jgi:hypothetical protein
MTDDLGPSWSHHVLQFLCHQDLSEADITATAVATLTLLANPQVPVSCYCPVEHRRKTNP